MKNYKRSDLACEAADDLTSIDGTEFSSFTKDNCRVESIKILTDDAALKLGKKVGTSLAGKAAIFGGSILIIIGIWIFVKGVFL